MPQPALSVSPASWTLSRMPSIESSIVPGHGAVDRRGRRLVFQRAGIGGDAAGRESRRGAAPTGSVRTSTSVSRGYFPHRPAPWLRAGRCDRYSHPPLRPAWSSGDISCPRCPGMPAAAEFPPHRGRGPRYAPCSCFFVPPQILKIVNFRSSLSCTSLFLTQKVGEKSRASAGSPGQGALNVVFLARYRRLQRSNPIGLNVSPPNQPNPNLGFPFEGKHKML